MAPPRVAVAGEHVRCAPLSFRGLRLGQVAIGVKRKYVSGGGVILYGGGIWMRGLVC